MDAFAYLLIVSSSRIREMSSYGHNLCLENHMSHSARYVVYRVNDQVEMQAKCRYAMPAPNGSIRAESISSRRCKYQERATYTDA